jgi:hypothetical protein
MKTMIIANTENRMFVRDWQMGRLQQMSSVLSVCSIHQHQAAQTAELQASHLLFNTSCGLSQSELG